MSERTYNSAYLSMSRPFSLLFGFRWFSFNEPDKWWVVIITYRVFATCVVLKNIIIFNLENKNTWRSGETLSLIPQKKCFKPPEYPYIVIPNHNLSPQTTIFGNKFSIIMYVVKFTAVRHFYQNSALVWMIYFEQTTFGIPISSKQMSYEIIRVTCVFFLQFS